MGEFTEVTPLNAVERGMDHHNTDSERPALELAIIENRAICQVFAAKGQTAAVASALSLSQEPGVASVSDQFTALPLSPGQWMLHSASGRDGTFCTDLRSRLTGIGYVSEQSHGRLIIRVSGSKARQLLQKGCRLDMHPSVMSQGSCAQTPVAQVGVLLHQIDDAPGYDLMIYSGFAQSFWHWLTESAAEFGYRVMD